MEKFIIDNRIFSTKFLCDLSQCKGACCTLKGAGGAPILDSEVKTIRSNVSIAKKYLQPENIDYLDTVGFLEGSPGDYSINSVDDEECVFSYYENDIVKCSFQKAYNNGETDFKKPISCHLFPIRISGQKRNIIRYEELYECSAALEKGKEENVSIFEFAKESLVREYGEDFYNDLREKFSKKG
ncbi:MAG: DUF3109 family protein [Ignavibacteria bacterium]